MRATLAPVQPATSIPVRPEIERVKSAAYETVHSFPGKAYQLAPLIDKSAHSLLNEVNPNSTGAKLGLIDAVRIMQETNDPSMLYEVASAMGYACVYLGDFTGTSDVELLESYAAFHREVGDMAREVAKALEDRKITRQEVEEIRVEGEQMIRAHLAFIARLEAIAE